MASTLVLYLWARIQIVSPDLIVWAKVPAGHEPGGVPPQLTPRAV